MLHKMVWGKTKQMIYTAFLLSPPLLVLIVHLFMPAGLCGVGLSDRHIAADSISDLVDVSAYVCVETHNLIIVKGSFPTF